MTGQVERVMAKNFKRVGESFGCEVDNISGDMYTAGIADKLCQSPEGVIFMVELKMGNPETVARLEKLLRDPKKGVATGRRSQRQWIKRAGERGSQVYVVVRNRHADRWAFVHAVEFTTAPELSLEYYDDINLMFTTLLHIVGCAA